MYVKGKIFYCLDDFFTVITLTQLQNEELKVLFCQHFKKYFRMKIFSTMLYEL